MLEQMEWFGSGCSQCWSNMAYCADVFPGFINNVGGDMHERASLSVHGWYYHEVHSVFLEVSRRASTQVDVFAVVDFILARLPIFVSESWLTDATNPLQVF